MSYNRYMNRREFILAAGLLGLYLWILTSNIGCFFKRSPESDSPDETVDTTTEEVTPTPTLVEQSTAPTDEEATSAHGQDEEIGPRNTRNNARRARKRIRVRRREDPRVLVLARSSRLPPFRGKIRPQKHTDLHR